MLSEEEGLVQTITSPFGSLNLGEPSLSDYGASCSATEWYDWVAPSSATFWLANEDPEEAQEALKSFKLGAKPDPEASEEVLQTLFVKKLQSLAKKANSRLTIIDTHSKPTLRSHPKAKPRLKPDIAFLASKTAPKDAAHFVAVGEFKKGNDVFSDDNRAQALTYCHRLMTVHQPGRRVATAFLLNTAYVQFVKVELVAGKLVYNYTDHQTWHEKGSVGLDWLYTLLASSSGDLGYEKVANPFAKYPHSRLLGYGMSSKVYSVYNQPNMVIKLYKRPEANEEAAILRKLKGWGLEHVPTLLEEDTKTNSALRLAPRAEDLVASKFNLHHALQALETLEKLHDNKHVHRDIRPSNLLLNGKDVLVNDWGYAIPMGEERIYAGAFLHASDRVLEYLANGTKVFVYEPSDDLVSLVRTAFVLTFHGQRERLEQVLQVYKRFEPNAAKLTLDTWRVMLPESWLELQDHAKKRDYKAIQAGFRRLLPSMENV